jgi:hypothetical protein
MNPLTHGSPVLSLGHHASSTSVLWFGPEYVHNNACISMRARHTYYLPIQRKSKRSRKCPKSHSERNTYIHVLQPCLHHWKVVHCNNYWCNPRIRLLWRIHIQYNTITIFLLVVVKWMSLFKTRKQVSPEVHG